MSNLNRFVAAVAHITDFPIEESDCLTNRDNYQMYAHKGCALVAAEQDSTLLITVHNNFQIVYTLRVYGGNTVSHQTLRRMIKLDSKTGKWVTYYRDTAGMAFNNLYDAMMHCGGTHGWI